MANLNIHVVMLVCRDFERETVKLLKKKKGRRVLDFKNYYYGNTRNAKKRC